MKVKFSDIETVFEMGEMSSELGENRAWIDRETGTIHEYCEGLGGEAEENELPEDIDNAERYLPFPDKRDLDLGTRLVFNFVSDCMPDDYDRVRSIFSKRGAYGRFKSFLEGRGALDRWYDYENKARETALRAWCEDEGVELIDET